MRLEVSVRKKFRDFCLQAEFQATAERLGVFGPSGSGKSTLLSLIAGLLPPDEGRVALDGQVVYSHEKKVHVPPERRRVAVVFQQSHLFPHMTVRENLLYGYRRCPPVNRRIELKAVAEVLRLGHVMDRNVRHLSGGRGRESPLAGPY